MLRSPPLTRARSDTRRVRWHLVPSSCGRLLGFWGVRWGRLQRPYQNSQNCVGRRWHSQRRQESVDLLCEMRFQKWLRVAATDAGELRKPRASITELSLVYRFGGSAPLNRPGWVLAPGCPFKPARQPLAGNGHPNPAARSRNRQSSFDKSRLDRSSALEIAGAQFPLRLFVDGGHVIDPLRSPWRARRARSADAVPRGWH
jgi:hypothetical protein